MMACPDCDGFATQLENVLRSAPGLTVKPIRNGMTITGFKGVALAVRNKSQLPPSVATVLNAFRAAGLELPVIEGQPNNADSDAVLIVAQPIT
jgi:1,4-dihydroxy-2-naphthoyl-CoA hydrolase